MTRLPLFVLPGVLIAALGVSLASAQEAAPSAPAHVAYVEGRALVDHDATTEDVEPNLPLDTGDRLRTEQGRVEVLFGDGSILQLDEATTIDVLSDSLVRELTGRVAIIAGPARAGRFQIDTPAGSVRITGAGEYRVSVFDEGTAPEVEVAVIRGSADLFTDRGAVSIGAGARALARQGEAPSQPMSFNSARWDAFDRWSQDRLSLRRGAASYRYVPPPVRPYGAVLDAYGSWTYEPTYGYVWFPHVVSGWRPYYQGRWRFYARHGWTWVGGDVWTWPTHHYGRWGTTSAGAWFWVPGPTWGAAWVHWAVSPGYVSWCPLGFDGRPVVPFGYGYSARPYYRSDPWRAWTIVPRDHFGGRGSITRVAVDGRRFGAEGMRPFVLQATPPPRPYAVARAGAAPRGAVAGAGLSPRGSAVATPRGAGERAGEAASREWGRDLRWSTRQPDQSAGAAQRGTVPGSQGGADGATPSSRRADRDPTREPGTPATAVGHYGTAVPRRPVSENGTPTAGAARPPRVWSADSVPVYRGGAMDAPVGARGAPRASDGDAGPSRRAAGSSRPMPSDSPRAVPRGGSPEYGSTGQPADYSPRTSRPGGDQAPASRPPAAPVYSPPPPSERPDGGGRRYRESPGAGAPPPSAAPREAPDRGRSADSAPRGGAEPRGRAEPRSQGSAPAGGARSGHRR